MRIFGRRVQSAFGLGERGESNLGCVVLIAVFILLAWIGFKIGRPFFVRQAMDEKVGQEIVLFQAKSDDELREAILEKAREYEVPISADDIEIVRPAKSRIEISISWNVDVEFPMDKHFRKTMVVEKEAHTSF